MTVTLLFWIRIGIIGFIIFTIWTIIRILRKQPRIIPSSAEELKRLLPEVLFLGLGIFLLFWLQKNFQRQIDIVIDKKDQQIEQVYFTNLRSGLPDSLSAYKGKVVLLNLWATWCGPCRKEMPELEELYEDYKNELVILALSDEREVLIRQFMQTTPYQFIVGNYIRHPMLDSLDSRPVSILIDKENRVKDVTIGARGYSFFKNWITPYLGNKK